MKSQQPHRPTVPGLTPTSLIAGTFAMLLMSVVIQYAEVVLGIAFPAEHTLALPALWVFLLISMFCGLVYFITKKRLLSRGELLCIIFAMLIAAPLMTQGFWHRIVSIIATSPKAGEFDKIDALNDKLWPHGANLLTGAFTDRGNELTFTGGHAFEDVEYEKGVTAKLPVLTNSKKEDVSTVRIRLPLKKDGNPFVSHGEPYIVSVLTRATDLGPDAKYSAKIVSDDGAALSEVFTSTDPMKVTFLHKTGFRRIGAYNRTIPDTAKDYVDVEFALSGIGRVELADPKMFSVGALEGIYKGRLIVSETAFDKLPENERAGLIIKPDNMFSPKGVAFLLSGYIPVKEWLVPMLAWTSMILLILMGTLAIVCIMRKQWLDNERFLLPLTRVPIALVDDEGEVDRALPPIWRNPLMWSGFILSLAWVLWKSAVFHNPSLPDPTINVKLQQYLSDPGWGTMFSNTRFEINAIFLSLCIFMELNVLASIVIGYWLFRSQGWIGEITGWKTNPAYPWPNEQHIGAYLGYALATIFFVRKYLWRTIKAAIDGGSKSSANEVMSYRKAFILLISCFVGTALWAMWMGMGVGGVLLFFTFLMVIGFVAAKLRTEAGLPWGYMAPQVLVLFMTLFGGIRLFGPEAMMFCFVASFFLGPTVFFLIPGAQLEMVELGLRYRVKSSHIIATIVLAVMAGMLIGGWGFLSNSYSMGGATMRYTWAYDTKVWYFFAYNSQMNNATNAMLGTGPQQTGWFDPAWYGWGYGAISAIIVTALRQNFAGFFLHPIGFVLGSANFMDYVWGSAAAAFVIRGVALWLGGAATVRNKLRPFFIGFFLGAIIAEGLIGVHSAYLRSIGIDKIFQVLTP